MKYENFELTMSDGNKNSVHQWTSDEKVDFVIVLSHGMAEHGLRYEELASFICENNGALVVEDHRGHGRTAQLNGTPLGWGGKNATFRRYAEDIHENIHYAKNRFPQSKIILAGHSYGSFLAQYVIENYGKEMDKAVLLGTAGPRNVSLFFGRIFGFIVKTICGERKFSKLLNNVAMGSYNDRCENARTGFEWISSDPMTVDLYNMDNLCGFPCSAGFMYNLFKGLINIHSNRNMKKINRDLPVLIMSGTDDPVGSYGKTVKKLAAIYCKNGMKDLHLKLYNGARHELVNEKCRYKVIDELISFCKN